MTCDEGRRWLELLAEMAPQLRQQGVYELELGPLKTKLALQVVDGGAPSVRERLEDDEPEEPIAGGGDPLEDPDTFDGTNVPGYPALRG